MSKTATAVLLSALVLPGAGHLYLKHSRRGMVLIAISLVCLWFIVDGVMRQVSLVLGQLDVEGGALDASRISELAAQASNGPENSAAAVATLVLIVCWLIGMADAYRIGKKTG